MPRNSQAASANRRVTLIHSEPSRPVISAPDTERERDREQRVPRIEHRRVDHHARVQQQRIETRALAGGVAVVVNGFAKKIARNVKNELKPSSTAVA